MQNSSSLAGDDPCNPRRSCSLEHGHGGGGDTLGGSVRDEESGRSIACETSATPVPALALGYLAEKSDKIEGAKQTAHLEGGDDVEGRGSTRVSLRPDEANTCEAKPEENPVNVENGGALRISPSRQQYEDDGGDRGSRGKDGEGATRTYGSNTRNLVPVKRRMSMQDVAADVVEKVYANTYVCNLCLLTLTVSFMADVYPGVPSHNVPTSVGLLWAACNVDNVRALRRRSFSYTLSGLVLLSLIMDLDFLAPGLKTHALRELERGKNSPSAVAVENDMYNFARVTVGVVAVLQSFSWQAVLATSPQGIHTLNVLWQRFRLFLPIWGSPAKLTKEVYNRLVALAWAHVLGCLALAIMAGIGAIGFEWAPQFASSQGAAVPLSVLCFAKSLTNLLVSGALFRNMDLALCLNAFGCMTCFQGWHRAREERRHARHGVTYPKVILEWDYIMLCSYIKIFDLLVGVWLWSGLGWSWDRDLDYAERHSVRVLLIAITLVQTLTDIWCIFLGITVYLLVTQYLLRKEKSKTAATSAFGGGERRDRDVKVARSLTSGRLLAESTMSDRSSPGWELDGRRARWEDERRTVEKMESDEGSYSTGESESGGSESDGDGTATSDDSTEEASPRRSAQGTISGVEVNFDKQTLESRAPASGNVELGDGSTGIFNSSRAAVLTSVQSEAEATAEFRRRRKNSIFAPGGSHLVYKRAFSARSSSDDSTIEGSGGMTPLPASISLDKSFLANVEEFKTSWEFLGTCASFRCRIGNLPEVKVMESHLREQGFYVVASGVISNKTKIYVCARGIGVPHLFLAELVFESTMNELSFTFKCEDERLTPKFVCHMHLRQVIGDHQAIA